MNSSWMHGDAGFVRRVERRVRDLLIQDSAEIPDPQVGGTVTRCAHMRMKLSYRGHDEEITVRGIRSRDQYQILVSKTVSRIAELRTMPAQTKDGQLCLL